MMKRPFHLSHTAIGLVLILMVGWAAASAGTPPALLNYQGVLRSAAGAPLDGAYDMTFRLWSADTGGDEILVDSHLLGNAQAVTVTGGLFSAAIGAGAVLDGPGPGTFASLAEVFRDYPTVWLEVQVGAETLSPRTRILSAAYAQNATHLDGRPSSGFLDTSATTQTKAGALQVIGPDAMAMLGVGGNGGGTFQATSGSGRATVARADSGIESYGSYMGGYFADLDGTSRVHVARGGYGIEAYGSERAGHFQNSLGSGNAQLGYGDWGLRAAGDTVGGSFVDLNESGVANVGFRNLGIQGWGNEAGGQFLDSDGSGSAYVGFGNLGISGEGNEAGGFFQDLDSSGQAYVGFGDFGVSGAGNTAGGFFRDQNSSGQALVGSGDRGIWGKGTFAGGTFSHPDNVTHWADVSTPTRKIVGTGTVSFVQNHPYEKDKVVVYAAPEGDEVAVYTRGSARLVDGEARVKLGESFAWVANPDIGLTAHLTPRSDAGLYVESVSSSELVVRTRVGSVPDASFDYIVYGLRIGFEDVAPVQMKDREAFLPARQAVEDPYAQHPELRRFSAMERFNEMRSALGENAPLDLSRSRALAQTINENRAEILARAAEQAAQERAARAPTAEGSQVTDSARAEGGTSRPATSAPPLEERTASVGVEPSVQRSTTMLVSEPVEAGDLLVLDPGSPGLLRRAASAADPAVVAVAAAASESVAGLLSVAVVDTLYATVRADASYGAIGPGDLLISSPTPGHAMRGLDPAAGTVIGKALEALETGTGQIRVLIVAR